MVLMTMIARVVDGLPLAATMQEDEQVTMKNGVDITFDDLLHWYSIH